MDTGDFGGQPPPHLLVAGPTPTTTKGFFKGKPNASTSHPGPSKSRKSRYKPYFKAVPNDGPETSKRPQIGSKTSEPTILISPRRSWFVVFTTNQGLPSLCAAVFSFMLAQNPKLNITLAMMKYASCIAYWNRLSQLNQTLGYVDRDIPDTYNLNFLAKSIKLPALLAQYIASFGEVKLPSGTKILPSFPEMDDPDYHWPSEFWQECFPEVEPPPDPWTLDPQLIAEWNEKCSKGGKVDFGLKYVDYGDVAGHDTMTVSVLSTPGEETHRPVAPMAVSIIEAQTGAAFQYRQYRGYNQWPGLNAELLFATHEATPIYPRSIISSLCDKLSRRGATPLK